MQTSNNKFFTLMIVMYIALFLTAGDGFGQEPSVSTSSTATKRASDVAAADVSLVRDPQLHGSEPYMDAVRSFIKQTEPKLVGGKKASDGAFPWQVSLGVSWMTDSYKAHFCGGSVYSDRWIITAAHCAESLTPSQIVITAGTNRLGENAIRRNVKRMLIHKNYNKSTTDYDIALIELFEPLPLTNAVKPVPLLMPASESALLKDGTSLVVTGWGSTQQGGNPVRELQYIDNLPYVSQASCNRPLAYDGSITENMICAGNSLGGRDSCQGDSGGPLTVETTTAPKLAGIVSWGEGCARPNKFGVYTRVSKFIDWIRDCVSGAASCNR